jgi:hypothetical protein
MSNTKKRIDPFDATVALCVLVALAGLVAMTLQGRVNFLPHAKESPSLSAEQYAAMREAKSRYYDKLQEKRESEWLRGHAIAAVTE